MKPIWLLDIDGVINIDTPRAWKDDGIAPLVEKIHGFTLRVMPQVRDFINQVHADRLAEVRWHTTWQKDAKLVAEAFGFGDFEVQEAPEFLAFGRYPQEDWWKLPAALRVVGDEGRPLIWTDDDIDYCNGQARRECRQTARDVAKVLISPNPHEGLAPLHLRQIREFIEEVITL